MEKVLSAGGNPWVIGLEWVKMAGVDQFLAAKALAKTRGAKSGVIRSIITDDGVVINQVGLSQSKAKGSSYSAAASLSEKYPSMVAITHLEADLYWLCVSDNGRVLPGLDIVTSDSEVKKLFYDFSSEYEISYMSMVMTQDTASALGIDFAVIGVDPVEVLGSTTPDESHKIRPIGGMSPRAKFMAGLFAAGIVGYFAFTQVMAAHERNLREQAAREMAEQEAMIAQKIAVNAPTEDELYAAAKLQEQAWLLKDINSLSSAGVLLETLRLADSLPLFRSGWSLRALALSGESPTAATSIWVRDGGTVNAFVDYFKSFGRPAVTANLETGVVTHTVKAYESKFTDFDTFFAGYASRNQDLSDALILSRLNFTVEVEPQGDRIEPIKGIKDKTTESQPQLSLKIRKYEIKGTSRREFVELMKIIESAKNIIPVSVEISRFGGRFDWTFVGKLYEV